MMIRGSNFQYNFKSIDFRWYLDECLYKVRVNDYLSHQQAWFSPCACCYSPLYYFPAFVEYDATAAGAVRFETQ